MDYQRADAWSLLAAILSKLNLMPYFSTKYGIVKSVKHLSVDLLERCALRELSEREMRRIEKHVLVCADCLDQLEGEMAWVVAIRAAAAKIRKRERRVSAGPIAPATSLGKHDAP